MIRIISSGFAGLHRAIRGHSHNNHQIRRRNITMAVSISLRALRTATV